jgi:hypothetical protein
MRRAIAHCLIRVHHRVYGHDPPPHPSHKSCSSWTGRANSFISVPFSDGQPPDQASTNNIQLMPQVDHHTSDHTFSAGKLAPSHVLFTSFSPLSGRSTANPSPVHSFTHDLPFSIRHPRWSNSRRRQQDRCWFSPGPCHPGLVCNHVVVNTFFLNKITIGQGFLNIHPVFDYSGSV